MIDVEALNDSNGESELGEVNQLLRV